MTRLGRQHARILRIAACFGVLALAATDLLPGRNAAAATTEQIVVDRNTGLAIYGFDPVAYFTDREARAGREDLEASFGGAVWRFRNEGNLAAFKDDPQVYMPQFGGHDPVGIADGIARAGNPEYFSVKGDKLFLFYSEEAKKAFDADPELLALQAEANWPHVSRTLAP